uniref:Uncharacterized protein n=1 Tax=Alexandrium catenella TaxID=2925 RepID=A0A7S1SCJ0_ALECA
MLPAGRASLLCCLLWLGPEPGRLGSCSMAAESEEAVISEAIAQKEQQLEMMAGQLRAVANAGESAVLQGLKLMSDAMEAGLRRARELEGAARLEALQETLDKRADFANHLNKEQDRLEDEGRRDGPFSSANVAAEL